MLLAKSASCPADGPVTVVALNVPKLDEPTMHQLARPLSDTVERRSSQVVHLDLSQVDYLTSTAVGRIVGLYRKFKEDGGKLVLTNVAPLPYEVFQVTGLTRLLDVRPAALPYNGL